MNVRLDKWLQVARVFKTRSRATRECSLGRVRVNGTVAKPHRTIVVGDRIEIDLRDWTRILEVKEVRDRSLPKTEAARLFDDLSPPRPVPDAMERLMRRPPVRRASGAGRPTKKERRDLDTLRDS